MKLQHYLVAIGLMLAMMLSVLAASAGALRQGESESLATGADGGSPSAHDAVACQWYVYDGAMGEAIPYWSDPEGTPPFALRTNGDFLINTVTLAERGGLDFEGDGLSDPFRIRRRPDNLFQWQRRSSSSASAAWVDMAYAAQPLGLLGFGDFNADSKTDVFSTLPPQNGLYQWVYSASGTGSYTDLNFSSISPGGLALGQFNAQPLDGLSDVFGALETAPGSGTYDYQYSAAGLGLFQPLSQGLRTKGALRFGDFDGNGVTDLFWVEDMGNGLFQWRMSADSRQPAVDLAQAPYGLQDIQLGDFEADGLTDIFATHELPDGRLEWLFWSGGKGDALLLNTVDGPPPLLGQFINDDRTDALTLRCGAEALISTAPPQKIAHDAGTLFYYYLGDVNGDGRTDAIRVSNCQKKPSFGQDCAETKLQTDVLLSNSLGRLTHQPLQTLLNDAGEYEAYIGDVTGDGRADLALIVTGGKTWTVRVGRAQADGTFVLGDQQTLSVPDGAFPYLADVNGDGRLDLLGTTICQLGNGYDGSGCLDADQNEIVSALAAANGTFGPPEVTTLPGSWRDFKALIGDINGDGKTDLIFNSTCQAKDMLDNQCLGGKDNLVYAAPGDGSGGFQLLSEQNYGSDYGWEYRAFIADISGDKRDDLIWLLRCPHDISACEGGDALLAGTALSNGNGTFQAVPRSDLGWGHWTHFEPRLGDMDGDGKTDLLLYYGGTSLLPALAYRLISDGAGSFVPSPMQVLEGKGVYSSAVLVGDLTGNGRDEFIAYRSELGSTDPLVVGGDLRRELAFVPLIRG